LLIPGKASEQGNSCGKQQVLPAMGSVCAGLVDSGKHGYEAARDSSEWAAPYKDIFHALF
jgi:hypothetical protein